jgi:DNA-binding SARP family transcriptional activator
MSEGGEPVAAIYSTEEPRLRVSLLGGFRLESAGIAVVLPEGSKRLIAFLALKGRVMQRQAVAGTLWPDATDSQGSSSLRSALTRLRGRARGSLTATVRDLGLSEDVKVDLWEARELAHHLLDPTGASSSDGPGREAISALSADLLPDSYDDWAIFEAEDWRQLRLHALEVLADRFRARKDFGDAAAAALAAIRAEPLRESPRVALIRVHIEEGNPTEALREFARYRELLMLELGVEPTERLRALVADLWPSRRRDGLPASWGHAQHDGDSTSDDPDLVRGKIAAPVPG